MTALKVGEIDGFLAQGLHFQSGTALSSELEEDVAAEVAMAMA